jgi:hypothetical protein
MRRVAANPHKPVFDIFGVPLTPYKVQQFCWTPPQSYAKPRTPQAQDKVRFKAGIRANKKKCTIKKLTPVEIRCSLPKDGVHMRQHLEQRTRPKKTHPPPQLLPKAYRHHLTPQGRGGSDKTSLFPSFVHLSPRFLSFCHHYCRINT